MTDPQHPDPAPVGTTPAASIHHAIGRWGAVVDAMKAAGQEAKEAKESAAPAPLAEEVAREGG